MQRESLGTPLVRPPGAIISTVGVSVVAARTRGAGADLKAVQEQLGHATVVLTADTYTSVLSESQPEAAEAIARLVLDTGKPGEAIRRQLRRDQGVPSEVVVAVQKRPVRGCRPR
jgi:hypothetical protein